MTTLETLLAAIDAMAAACDRGSTHYVGCEAVHPRCAVYRAADAVRADGIPIPATLETRGCAWIHGDVDDYYATGCGEAFSLMDGAAWENDYRYCPACGGRIVEVTDG